MDAVEAVHAVLREYNESLTYGNDLDSMVVLKTKLAFKKEVLRNARHRYTEHTLSTATGVLSS